LTPSPVDRIPLLGAARRGLHQLTIFYAERRQRELLAVIENQRAAIQRLEGEIALSQANPPL
ncbi:MAG: hypothetical protein WAU10_24000, partial [Caldilineaceae bacterium]